MRSILLVVIGIAILVVAELVIDKFFMRIDYTRPSKRGAEAQPSVDVSSSSSSSSSNTFHNIAMFSKQQRQPFSVSQQFQQQVQALLPATTTSNRNQEESLVFNSNKESEEQKATTDTNDHLDSSKLEVSPLPQQQQQLSTTSGSNELAIVPSSVVMVQSNDYIYGANGYHTAPVVLESHKLLFFTIPKIGCTVWLKLFRRMMGYDDWKTGRPYNPLMNGLTYLYHYSLENATVMMNDPTWTRAIVVRDPKERLVSAYLDKVFHKNGTLIKDNCCRDSDPGCYERATTFEGFFQLVQKCPDDHWRHQSHRMERKFLPLLNFVGHLETMTNDAERLLKRIGAWDDYGQSGWGRDGTEAIFSSKSDVQHKTSDTAEASRNRLAKYYSPRLERLVERWFAEDYMIPQFHLTNTIIHYN